METRKCSKCGKKLFVDKFSINHKSGELYKVCNSCKEKIKSYREANKEKIAVIIKPTKKRLLNI